MNVFDDFEGIITSKQTVNMPVVEVKFGNDDNEVQGYFVGGTAHHVPNRQLGIMEHRIGRDETDVGCSSPCGSVDYVNDIFSSDRRMRHASVCVAPRTTR